MKKDLIIHWIKKSGLLTSAELAALTIKPLGRSTNEVYLLKIPHKKNYILKIPNPSVRPLIDYRHEYEANLITTTAGINIPIVYFDRETGIHISPYQENCEILDKNRISSPVTLSSAASLLHQLHHSSKPFYREVNIFLVLDYYQQFIKDKWPTEFGLLSDWQPILEKLRAEFQKKDIVNRPCHCDPTLSNFLWTTENKLFLIDWEYAGNNDPCWDLATFIADAEMTQEQEQQFLSFYFQKTISDDVKRRLQVYKVLFHYLWSLWGIVIWNQKDKTDQFYQLAHFHFQISLNQRNRLT